MFFSFFKEHGTSGTKQMGQDFPIIPGKSRKEEYFWNYSFFTEKNSVEKSVVCDLPLDQSDFPYKGKAPDIWKKPFPRVTSCDLNLKTR